MCINIYNIYIYIYTRFFKVTLFGPIAVTFDFRAYISDLHFGNQKVTSKKLVPEMYVNRTSNDSTWSFLFASPYIGWNIEKTLGDVEQPGTQITYQKLYNR